MDFKDYYEILGVAPNADKKLIQQTFRQLARKHHPDVNPGNKEAEEKFKTINEAYQVLSDEKQRKKYDELRAQYLQWQQAGGQQGGISIGKTGQPNPAKTRTSNMPPPKTWKIYLGTNRRIPISSPIFLDRRAKAAAGHLLRPARAGDVMSNTKLI